MVYEEYNKSLDYKKGTLSKGLFLQDLFFHNRLLNGSPVTPEFVISVLERAKGLDELVHFYAFLCLNRIPVRDEFITPERVMAMAVNKDGETIKAHFLESLFWGGALLEGEPVSADRVLEKYRHSGNKQSEGRFLEMLCLEGVALKNGPVTAESVYQLYEKNTRLSIIFLTKLCLQGIPLNGAPVTPGMVIGQLQELPDSGDIQARFLKDLFLQEIKLEGEFVSPESVVTAYENINAEKELSWFLAELCLRKVMLNHEPVRPETIIERYRQGSHSFELAQFYRKLYEAGMMVDGETIMPEMVYETFQAIPGNDHRKPLELACFQELLFFQNACLYQVPVTAEQVAHAFDKGETEKFRQARALFLRALCLQGCLLNGQRPTPEEVRDLIPVSKSGRMDHARFLRELFFKDMMIDGQFVSPERVAAAFPETNKGRFERARFLEDIRSGEAGEPTLKKSQQPPISLLTFPTRSLQSVDNASSENEVIPVRLSSPVMNKSLESSSQNGVRSHSGSYGDNAQPRLLGSNDCAPVDSESITSGALSTVLGLINEVNTLYPSPVVAATKKLLADFQANPEQKGVIQLIGTNEGIEKLAQKIQAECLDQKSEPAIRCHFSQSNIQGCSLLQIPGKVSMTLTIPGGETSLVIKADTFPQLPVVPQNIERKFQEGKALTTTSIPSYSSDEELLLMSGRINQLSWYLSTSGFFTGEPHIPQSIIFHSQEQYEEAMLMHGMMCLNKAEELGCLQASQQPMLRTSADWLENVIKQHPEFDSFVGFMESWLKGHTPNNDYEKRRHAFVTKIKDKTKLLQSQSARGSDA